jgi:hypothetical protein
MFGGNIAFQICVMDCLEHNQTGHQIGEEYLCAFVERTLIVVCYRIGQENLWLKPYDIIIIEEGQKPYKS